MKFRIVTIGTSLGGFDALSILFGALSREFPLPIAVVQHRSADDSDTLVSLLSRCSNVPVKEVNDKDPIEAGNAYVAPPDYHLIVEEGHFALSTDEPVRHARPSIDVLFESAAESYREGVIAVLLTGSSADGTDGASRVKQAGGMVIVQDPATAEGREMPRSAIASVEVDSVLPLTGIASYLTELCREV